MGTCFYERCSFKIGTLQVIQVSKNLFIKKWAKILYAHHHSITKDILLFILGLFCTFCIPELETIQLEMPSFAEILIWRTLEKS